MDGNLKESAYTVVKTVATPLRFFALVLVVLGGIVMVLAWKSTLPPELTSTLILVAFGIFVLLLVLVTVLVVFFPKKLTFDQEAHLSVLREQLGDSELRTTYIVGTLPATGPQSQPSLPKRTEEA